jgi:hypothetical protein
MIILSMSELGVNAPLPIKIEDGIVKPAISAPSLSSKQLENLSGKGKSTNKLTSPSLLFGGKQIDPGIFNGNFLGETPAEAARRKEIERLNKNNPIK